MFSLRPLSDLWYCRSYLQNTKCQYLIFAVYCAPLLNCHLTNSISSHKGHLTAKSDVYSFGVVLLEILSGKKAIDKNRPTGEHNLVEWAKPCLSNKRRIFRVLDPRLEGQYSLGRALKLANLALQCLCMEPKMRPTMDEVVTTLEELQDNEKRERRDPHGVPSANKARSCRQEVGHGAVAYPRPSASLRA